MTERKWALSQGSAAGGEVPSRVPVIKSGAPRPHVFDLVTIVTLFLDFISLLVIQPLFNHSITFLYSWSLRLKRCSDATSENSRYPRQPPR